MTNSFSPPPTHWGALHYLQYEAVTKKQFDNYFKFAFVRNPFDRIVSEYKYRRHPRRYAFKDYLFKHFPIPGWSDQYCHIVPQYDFLFDENGEQLVDFIGRYESLTTDFQKVCEILSLPTQRLEHQNRSSSFFGHGHSMLEIVRTLRCRLNWRYRCNTHTHYTDYYDDECVQFIERMYQKDIETFDYTFGGNQTLPSEQRATTVADGTSSCGRHR